MGTGALCFIYYRIPVNFCLYQNWQLFLSYLQEVMGVTMTAFQKVSMPLLWYKAGNVAWDTNIQAIHDCKDQLWPAECAQVKICNYFFSVHYDFEISTKQKTT